MLPSDPPPARISQRFQPRLRPVSFGYSAAQRPKKMLEILGNRRILLGVFGRAAAGRFSGGFGRAAAEGLLGLFGRAAADFLGGSSRAAAGKFLWDPPAGRRVKTPPLLFAGSVAGPGGESKPPPPCLERNHRRRGGVLTRNTLVLPPPLRCGVFGLASCRSPLNGKHPA